MPGNSARSDIDSIIAHWLHARYHSIQALLHRARARLNRLGDKDYELHDERDDREKYRRRLKSLALRGQSFESFGRVRLSWR